MNILYTIGFAIGTIFSLIILYFFSAVGFCILITRFPVFKDSDDYYFNLLTKQVYFSPQGNWFALGFNAIPNIKNRGQLKKIDHIGSHDGLADGHRFFIMGIEKPEVNAKSETKMLGYFYLLNEKKVYYVEDTDLFPLPSVDSESYRLFEGEFKCGRDRNSVFYKNLVFPGADPNSVNLLNSCLVLNDKFNIFFVVGGNTGGADKIEKFPLKSSQVKNIDWVYFDGFQVFYLDYNLKKVVSDDIKDPASLSVTEEQLIFDSKIIFRKDLFSR